MLSPGAMVAHEVYEEQRRTRRKQDAGKMEGKGSGVTTEPVARVHHFSFTVSDVDRAVKFYMNVFGFVTPRQVRHLDTEWIGKMTAMTGAALRIQFVELHDVQVELIEYVRPTGKQRCDTETCDTGSAHLAFCVEDLDEALTAAERFGGQRVGDPVKFLRVLGWVAG